MPNAAPVAKVQAAKHAAANARARIMTSSPEPRVVLVWQRPIEFRTGLNIERFSRPARKAFRQASSASMLGYI